MRDYLHTFRDEAVFVEALSTLLCGDIMTAALPDSVCVRLRQPVRGGIVTEAVSALTRAQWDASGGATS